MEIVTLTADDAPYQTRDGQRFHKDDFFYTPSDQSGTWKLLKTGTPGGAPDAQHVGAAVAALGNGYRGETVDIPAEDRSSVIRQVRQAWKALHPDAEDADMPDVLRGSVALDLAALALELPVVDGHPNALPFRGILTRLDEPSDSPPDGAQGHCVLLSRDVAERALPSLLGMGIGVHPTLTRHDPRHKVGVITTAYIDGNALWVEGILYARDFPEDIADIQRLARRGELGMSFELAHAAIEDATSHVWAITSCVFTGAAILAKARAAYKTTALAAQEETVLMPEEPVVETQDPVALAAGMDELLSMMNTMASNMASYQACMNAVDKLLGMRAGLDSLTEALEHLVQMHQALHEAGDVEGGVKPMNAQDGQPQETAHLQATEARIDKLETMLTDLAASMKLLTDQQEAMHKLLTDDEPPRRTLVTDGAPARRTLAATGEYENFVGKYGLNAEQQYNEGDLDRILRDAGVTDVGQRLGIKMAMERQGTLVRQ